MQFTDPIQRLRAMQEQYYARYSVSDRPARAHLNPGVYGVKVTYRHEPAQELGDPLLAPLCSGLVSQIDLSQSYLDRTLDPVAAMVAQRTTLGKARIESVVDDMRGRYDLMRRNLGALDHQICYLDSQVLQLPDFRIGLVKDLDKTRTALEAKVLDLEQEKMRQEVSAWKDISRLKEELFTSLDQYSGASASAHLVQSYAGESND